MTEVDNPYQTGQIRVRVGAGSHDPVDAGDDVMVHRLAFAPCVLGYDIAGSSTRSGPTSPVSRPAIR